MTDKQIIHGEQEPLITLTRQQLEEDWFTLWELYKAKEQECERLKETLKTKAKGWANVNDKILEEVDQLKEQLEAYKMETEEGKEINAELKAENEELKELNTRLDNQREVYWKEYQKHKQAIEKVREIVNKPYLLPCGGDCKQQNCTDKTTENGKHCMELKLIQILQICDEVNDVQDNL